MSSNLFLIMNKIRNLMDLLNVMKIILYKERIIYYMYTGRRTIQIGGTIKNAREKLNFSQEKLAELVDCSVKTISNIENNKIPELKQIINICDVLGLSMDKLFDIALPKKNTLSKYEEKGYNRGDMRGSNVIQYILFNKAIQYTAFNIVNSNNTNLIIFSRN